MKRSFFTTAMIAAFVMLGFDQAKAQPAPPNDLPKFEVGADFSTMTFGSGRTELGLGGRLTYNLNKHVALEGAGYFFPRKCPICVRSNSGRSTEGLVGVKIGKRFEKWGLFAKVRPGFISFSDGQFNVVPIATILPSGAAGTEFVVETKRLTVPAVDVGGVLEFYPSKHIFTRLDFGSTIIHYPSRTNNFGFFDSTTGKNVLIPVRIPPINLGTLQVMAGVGFRF